MLSATDEPKTPVYGYQPGRIARQIAVPIEVAQKGTREQVEQLSRILTTLRSPEHEAELVKLDGSQLMVLLVQLLEQQLFMTNQIMGLLKSVEETTRHMNSHLRAIDIDINGD